MRIEQHKKVRIQATESLQLVLGRLVAEVPKNLDIKLSSNISVFTKTISSKIP